MAAFTAKSGSVVVRVEPARGAPGGVVCVGVPARVNASLLGALECGRAGGTHAVASAADADATLVAYACVLKVRAKLATDPKGRAARCAAFDGEFVVSVPCDRTMSSARKTAAAVLSAMRFGGLWKGYKAGAAAVGVKPDRAAFLHAAGALRAAAGRGVTVVVAGRVSVARAEIVATSAGVLAGKLSAALAAAVPSGRARAGAAFVATADGDSGCPAARHVVLPATGLQAALLCRFLASRGVVGRAGPGGVAVEQPLGAPAAEAKAAELFAKKWRAGRALLVYHAAVNCEAPTAALTVAGGAPDASWIVKALK